MCRFWETAIFFFNSLFLTNVFFIQMISLYLYWNCLLNFWLSNGIDIFLSVENMADALWSCCISLISGQLSDVGSWCVDRSSFCQGSSRTGDFRDGDGAPASASASFPEETRLQVQWSIIFPLLKANQKPPLSSVWKQVRSTTWFLFQSQWLHL